MRLFKNTEARNTLFIGSLCSASYLAVYVARNVLSACAPHMIGDGAYTTECIGAISSTFFMFYAIGQLINGIAGD